MPNVPTLRLYQARSVREFVDSVRHNDGRTFTVLISRQGGNHLQTTPTFDPPSRVSLRRL